MHRKNEYKRLPPNTRKRGWGGKNAQSRAQWESLATTYVLLTDQSKKIDDTGTSYNP
jgi:hypothetical protein